MLIIDRARHARLNRVREKSLQLIAKEEALPLPHEFQPFAPSRRRWPGGRARAVSYSAPAGRRRTTPRRS